MHSGPRVAGVCCLLRRLRHRFACGCNSLPGNTGCRARILLGTVGLVSPLELGIIHMDELFELTAELAPPLTVLLCWIIAWSRRHQRLLQEGAPTSQVRRWNLQATLFAAYGGCLYLLVALPPGGERLPWPSVLYFILVFWAQFRLPNESAQRILIPSIIAGILLAGFDLLRGFLAKGEPLIIAFLALGLATGLGWCAFVLGRLLMWSSDE